MPTGSYVHNNFYAAVGPLLGLVLCLSLIFPLSMLVRGIVEVCPFTREVPCVAKVCHDSSAWHIPTLHMYAYGLELHPCYLLAPVPFRIRYYLGSVTALCLCLYAVQVDCS